MTAVLSFIEMLGRDTRLLTARERDAYVNLIIAYEDQAAPLPDDDVRLALGARVSLRLWQRLRPLIETFFIVEGGLWRHERLDTQIAARNAAQATADAATQKRAALSAKRSRAAKVRWEKAHAAKLCKPGDLHMQTTADAHANADARLEISGSTVFSSAFESRREDSGSQEENTAHAKPDAKPAFASKGRKRRDTRPPQPMLRTFSAIPWWMGREQWVDLRFEIGTYEFDRTFGQCKPRDEVTLLAPDVSARDHILRTYGRTLARFTPAIVIVVDGEGAVPQSKQGAAA